MEASTDKTGELVWTLVAMIILTTVIVSVKLGGSNGL